MAKLNVEKVTETVMVPQERTVEKYSLEITLKEAEMIKGLFSILHNHEGKCNIYQALSKIAPDYFYFKKHFEKIGNEIHYK